MSSSGSALSEPAPDPAPNTSTARCASENENVPGLARSSVKSRPRARSSSYWNWRYHAGSETYSPFASAMIGRQVAVGLPGHSAPGNARVEAERAVLVVGGVDVAPGEVRLHREARRLGPVETPRQCHERRATHGDELVDDFEPVRQPVGPRRPRVAREPGEARGAIGVCDVRCVPLGRQRVPALGGLDPGVEPVDEDDAARRRRGRDGEHGVVTTRADAVDASRGEPAQSVGLEPFCGGRGHPVVIPRSGESSSSRPRGLSIRTIAIPRLRRYAAPLGMTTRTAARLRSDDSPAVGGSSEKRAAEAGQPSANSDSSSQRQLRR